MVIATTAAAPRIGPAITPASHFLLYPVCTGAAVALDDTWAAELVVRIVVEEADDTGTEAVAVFPAVLCPMTVCKVPCVRENTPFPAAQFANPLLASELQAKTLFPQGIRVPSLSFAGSSRTVSTSRHHEFMDPLQLTEAKIPTHSGVPLRIRACPSNCISCGRCVIDCICVCYNAKLVRKAGPPYRTA